MRDYCDLHTHSTESDGTLTPREIILAAKELGLAYVALTDHDTIAGIPEALCAAEEMGVELITGVELSVECAGLPIENAKQRSIHVLAYFSHENIYKMSQYQECLKEYRQERNAKMIEKAKIIGMPISLAELKKYSSGEIISKGHFYRVLIEKGYAKDKDDAFNRFLNPGGLIYAKKRKLTPKEAIEIIKKYQGVAVVAHPLLIGLNDSELDSTISYLKGLGFDGLEAVYGESSENQVTRVIELAVRHSMFVTGGSDFHGETKPGLKLGTGYGSLRVPKILAENILKRICVDLAK